MPRWQYFQLMGNNCRLLGLGPMASEAIVCGNPNAVRAEDYDNFFHGYWYGQQCDMGREVVNLPKWENVISPSEPEPYMVGS